MLYRIIQESYYNEFGAITRTSYLVQYQKKNFFGKLVWRFVEHKVSYESGPYWIRTEFNSPEHAQDYIDKILINGGAFQRRIQQVIKEAILSV